jgi:hypothetical protein
MENAMTAMLRQEIPTGYNEQIKFYKRQLEELNKYPMNKKVVNKLIGTLILMCHDQTGLDLNSLIQDRLEYDETLEQEIDGLLLGLNLIMDLNSYEEEQQGYRILYNYLILLNIVDFQSYEESL